MARRWWLGLTLICLLVSAPAAACVVEPDTVTLDFTLITDNSAYGEYLQVSVEISELADGRLLLDFYNTSLTPGVVTRIYFQDNEDLVEGYSILNRSGVYFASGNGSGNLPAGETVGFDSSFWLRAANPSPYYGIGQYEYFSMILDLDSNDALATLLAGLDDQTFNIGLHVQSLRDGGSESMVLSTGSPLPTVPEPGTFVLLGSALLAGLGFRRRLARETPPAA